MREVYGVRPIKLDVLAEDRFYDGPRTLEGDTPYKVEVLRDGERFKNEDGSVLQLRYRTGQTGGLHGISRRPGRGGLMPRRMVEPFEFLVGFGDASTDTLAGIQNWEGMSSRGIKDYYKLETDDSAFLYRERLLSYDGGLFLLAEQDGVTTGDNLFTRRVVLFRYDEDEKLFTTVKVFDDEIDIDNSLNTQSGSPDWAVINDELHIFFRTYNREQDENWLLGYKSSGDLVEWHPVTEQKIAGEISGEYHDFRMRVCYAYNTLMVGWFAYGQFDAGGGDTVEIPYYRTMVSFDDGLTVEENENSFVGITQSGRPDTNESLHPYFIPESPKAVNIREFKNWNVNFDLYFDENMGSFVIVKPGDPNPDTPFFGGQRPRNYLIGIKTEDGDFTSWEPCLQLLVDSSVTLITEGNGAFDDPPSTNGGLCYLEDVQIVPEGTANTIMVSMWEYTLGGGVYLNNGIALGEFAFVERSQIFPGSYDNVFAYGGKYHPRYSFLCSPLAVEYNGLVSVGSRMDPGTQDTTKWDSLAGCRWRSQLVVAGKPIEQDRLNFFAVVGPWTNLGEHIPYQLSYTPYLGVEPWNFNIGVAVSGTGNASFDTVNEVTTLTAVGGGDTAYLHTKKLSNTSEPPDWRAARDSSYSLKTKFEFKISETVPSGDWTEILSVSLGNPQNTAGLGYEFGIRLYGNGAVEVYQDPWGSIGNFAATLQDTKTWEVCFNMGRALGGDHYISMAYREKGTKDWTIDPELILAPTKVGTAGDPHFRVGVLDYSSWWGQTIDIGKLQVGTPTRRYAPVYTGFKQHWGSRIEDMMKIDALSRGESEVFVAHEAKLADNQIELSDGTLLKLSGPTGDKDYGVDLKYVRTPTRNSVKNLVDPLAHSVFDFTYQLDVNGRIEVVFENTERQDFDMLSLINLFGVTGVKFRVGTYDPDTAVWAGDTQKSYEIPYTKLDVVSISGSTAVLSDGQEFSDSELRDRVVMFWDGTDYADQLIVTDNFDTLVRFSSAVPALGGSGELRLMEKSVSFPVLIGTSNTSHVSVTFETPPTLQYAAAGGVYLGRKVDFTPFLDSVEKSTGSQNSIIEGQTGYDVMSSTFGETVFEAANLSFTQLGWADDGAEKVKRFFNWCSVNQKSFPMIFKHHDGVEETRSAAITNGVQMSLSSYVEDVQVQVALAKFANDFTSEIDLDAPVVRYTRVTTSRPDTNTSVTFWAVAHDPVGGSISYQWDLGDGIGTYSGQQGSYTWPAAGEYTITVTATSSVSGLSTTRSRKIYVEEAA